MPLTATDVAHATTLAALHAMAYEDRDQYIATGAPCVCPEENLDCGCGAYVPARRVFVAAENTHGWYVKDTFTGEFADGYYDTEDEADAEAIAMTSEAAHDVPQAR
jgi:hypothetical protein